MVTQFYADIAQLPQISDQEMCTSMQQLSIQQTDEFDTIAALKELYIYVTTYKDQVSGLFLEMVTPSCSSVSLSFIRFIFHGKLSDTQYLLHLKMYEEIY
jgi:plexin A